MDFKEDNLASTLQYSLVVVVPSFVLLGLIWIGYRAKKGGCGRGRPHRSRSSFNRDSFSGKIIVGIDIDTFSESVESSSMLS